MGFLEAIRKRFFWGEKSMWLPAVISGRAQSCPGEGHCVLVLVWYPLLGSGGGPVACGEPGMVRKNQESHSQLPWEGWHAWKRHPGRGWAGGVSPSLNMDKIRGNIWLKQVMFWLTFPCPWVIRGPQHCWAGQADKKDKDQKAHLHPWSEREGPATLGWNK